MKSASPAKTRRDERTADAGDEIRIDPELAAPIPPLTADERAQLEQSLLADGCRDALLVWEVDDG